MKLVVVFSLACVVFLVFSSASFAGYPFFDEKHDRAVVNALDDFEDARAEAVQNVSVSANGELVQTAALTIKPKKKKISLEAGYETYNYRYRELVDGEHFMHLDGTFQGVFGNFVYHPDKRHDALGEWADVYRIETRLAWADLNYDGGVGDYPLTMSGSPNMVVEARGLIGGEFEWRGVEYSPYGGIGFRYLRDDSSDQNGTLPNGQQWTGYKRVSRYSYVPIGIDVSKATPSGWGVKVNLEYDWFFRGDQRSLTPVTIVDEDDNTYQYDSIKNYQHNGYGLRGSFRLSKDFKFVGLFVEPFIRYWKIGDSELAHFDADPGYEFVGVAMEPNNTTHEVGAKFGMKF